MVPLQERTNWIFDLDNTLYPASCDLFTQIEKRMGLFVQQTLGVTLEEAKKVQKKYFREHGTTMRGMMTNHGVAAHDYMDFVHDIDFSVIKKDSLLQEALAALPGRRLIYTNASTKHAERTMEKLGIGHLFDDIFDIERSLFEPKPALSSYHGMMEALAVDPHQSVFFEDSAKNLVPAHDLGMLTVWVRTDTLWGQEGARDEKGQLKPYIHYETDNLPDWLSKIAA